MIQHQDALLVGNDDELTWSLSSDEPGVRLGMPTFNLARVRGGVCCTGALMRTRSVPCDTPPALLE